MTQELARDVPAYRVTAKIKNNRLWTAITERWPDVQSQRNAAERLNIRPTALCYYLSMRVWPGRKEENARYAHLTEHFYIDGWTLEAWKIANALHVTPEYIFDPVLYGRPLPATEITIEATVSQLRDSGMIPPGETPDTALLRAADADTLTRVLGTLTARQQFVITHRFGLEGPEETLAEVSDHLGISVERVRQIEGRALRRLRHPSKREYFRELVVE